MSSRTGHTIDVADVRRRHPIQDVVAAEGIELHRTGRSFMGCCPFHDDSTASLSVAGVPDKFHCFGCGASGDVIDFVARLHGLGFRDAVAHLDGPTTARMPLSALPHARSLERVPGSPYLPDLDAQRGFEVSALAWQWFSRPVAHEHAISYLRSHRGIDLRHAEIETGATFVGHTGHGWTTLVDHLRGRGVTDDELLALDLAQASRHGPLIDTLRDRIIIPVTDQHGQVAGFVGRDTSGHPKAPKYRNPTRTATFDKSTCLYRPTRTSVPDASVIVVEGALDALAITATAAAVGMTEQTVAVSTLGTTVSPSQARRVIGLSSEPPVIVMDGDDAGREGTLRWVDALCRQADHLALVAGLPRGADPADWLARHGTNGLAALNPAQRPTTHINEALRSARPTLPGRELAELACRGPNPVATAIAHIVRFDRLLHGNAHAQGALIDAAVAEMTRQGWNPNEDFTRAVAHAITRPPPPRQFAAPTPPTPTRDLL